VDAESCIEWLCRAETIAEPGILPDSAEVDLLPQFEVVILPATTLLNHTPDEALRHCRKAREIAVLGPTTPFLPGTFSRHGVTLLSGIQVTDSPQGLRAVSEAGGIRSFGLAVRKIPLRLPPR
jgi:uncharacterized protein (DUF4213/DUF364 family)